MIQNVITCDGPNCTATRGETNHWLLCFGGSPDHPFRIRAWNDDVAEEERVRHICGAACAHKLLDQYLGTLREAA